MGITGDGSIRDAALTFTPADTTHPIGGIIPTIRPTIICLLRRIIRTRGFTDTGITDTPRATTILIPMSIDVIMVVGADMCRIHGGRIPRTQNRDVLGAHGG